MNAVSNEFTERSRTRARSIKARLEHMGVEVTLGQAYEVLASADGFKNWATMKTMAATAVAAPEPDAKGRVPVEPELQRFIEQFNDFIELRQKLHRPKNRILITEGTLNQRRAFVEMIGAAVNRSVVEVNLRICPGEQIDWVITSSFQGVIRASSVLYLDGVERLSNAAIELLCRSIESIHPGTLLILGADAHVASLPLSIVGRMQLRQVI